MDCGSRRGEAMERKEKWFQNYYFAGPEGGPRARWA
jgi:hypothetical protein